VRPLRLKLKGFTAFREEQEVDFSELDLFAIAGPTGAGKSSLLDAMTYALYGRVERVGDRVGQLISQGLPQMAVELWFSVDGRRYHVTRRTNRAVGKAPATTRAILERLDGEEWVDEAGLVRDVDARIRQLIGLDYDGFTRAVLLPQGKFDQFLTGDPAMRRRILSDLLGLEMWERMARYANSAASTARKERDTKEEFLRTDFAEVSADRIAEIRKKAKGLRSRERKLVTVQETLREIVRRRDEARSKVADVRTCAKEARGLGETAAAAGKALKEVAKARSTAEKAVAQAREGVAAAEKEASAVTAALAVAVKKWGALRALYDARGKAEQYVDLRDEHSRLKKGDVCPTCGRILTEAPKISSATAKKIGALEDAIRAALGKLPRDPVGALDERIAALESLDQAARDAADELRQAERARDAAQSALEWADRRAEREYARLPFAALVSLLPRAAKLVPSAKLPRLPSRTPTAEELDELPAFASQLVEVASVTAGALAAAASLDDAEAAYLAEAHEAVGDLVPAARDLDMLAKSVDDAVRATAGDAKAAEDRAADIEKRLERRAQLETEIAGLAERERVMRALALDLRQDAIVEYVQAEALSALASEGSKRLSYLSSGRYRLRYRQDEFFVADENNGDEERSVRTLSGGECFLASLALALTLSEQVRVLATTEHARLESLFLDEGFGTLDSETLETVISAIERLGVDGRLVGVISHVRELTDQFRRVEVEKSARGSRIRPTST
jgi:DNA repair protein SbcC/Rad50